MGKDVIAAVRYCFKENYMDNGVNSTAITLVPKAENVNEMKDYRPISCCNVLYKCYSNVLIARIKRVLDEVRSSNETAFLKSRQILENVLLMHEIVPGYHRNGSKSRGIIKVDIMKAYDTINWGFLFETTKVIKFLNSFIN